MQMWNPWHGCHKISAGCKHCYVYREDAAFGTSVPTHEVRKTASFNLPLKRDRNKNWKFPAGFSFALCFTSDFLIEEADGRLNAFEFKWNSVKAQRTKVPDSFARTYPDAVFTAVSPDDIDDFLL